MKSPFLLVFAFLVLGLAGFKTAYSYLTDTEKKQGNILSVATDFGLASPSLSPIPLPTVSPSPSASPITSPSPSLSPSPSVIKLVINEVYYDVDARTSNGSTETEGNNEWIEIYNSNNFAVPFKDWQICDNNSCVTVNLNVDVPALGFALLSHDTNTWKFWTIPSGVEKINALGGTPLALNNNGDRVILKNPSGVVIDQMNYGNDTAVWNPAAGPVREGHSLEREPDGKDTDTAADFVDRDSPTPGS